MEERKSLIFQKIGYTPIEPARGIHETDKKLIVLKCGMRCGKSSALVPEAINVLTQKKKSVWVVGVDYGKTDRFIFGEGNVLGIKGYLDIGFPGLIQSHSLKDHIIKLKNGSKVVGKSVKYPDSFIADPIDLIVCEDANSWPDKFFDTYVRPRVVDTGGPIFVNGIPPLKDNWFTELHKREDVAAFSWGMKNNPFLKPEEVELLRRDLPPHLQATIIDGMDLPNDSSVFGNIRDAAIGGFAAYDPTHLYQAGVDVGKIYDRTVLAITDLTIGRCVYIDRFPPKFFKKELVEARLLNGLEKYSFPNTYIDLSGIGAILSSIADDHPFFLPFTIPNLKTRNGLIESLGALFQRGYTIPDIPWLVDEFESLDIILKSNYHVYRTRTGHHDDCIMAIALSVYGWTNRIMGDASSIAPIVAESKPDDDGDAVQLGGEGFFNFADDYAL